MNHLLGKLLCRLFLHKFATVDKTRESATVVCNRTHCLKVWQVDFRGHTMELVQKGAYEE